MTEIEALNILNDPGSKLTREEALNIISVLKRSVSEHDDALSEKILGSHSYYEGEYNSLRIAEAIINKIIIDSGVTKK